MWTPIAAAAKELSVSQRFLRQLIAENRIPLYRLSPRTLRVDLDELRDYMRFIAEGKPRVDDAEGSGGDWLRGQSMTRLSLPCHLPKGSRT